MEEENNSIAVSPNSVSPQDTETEPNTDQSTEPNTDIDPYLESNQGVDGLSGSPEGGQDIAGSGTELVVKRKRGRPRKYGSDAQVSANGNMTAMVSSPPAFPATSCSVSSPKRGRGRPKGSGKLQLLASIGGYAANTVGGGFIPHVVTIYPGEDIASKILSFSMKGPRAVCILSATGVVSNVVLRQPFYTGGFLTYEGRFEILNLSGSFVYSEARGKNGMLSVALAKPDGRVFGGAVAGPLIAAGPGPVELVVGSFKQDIISRELKRRQSSESSTCTSMLAAGNSDMVKVPLLMAPTTNNHRGESCIGTPTSALLEPPQSTGGGHAIPANQNMNHPPSLPDFGDQNVLQPMTPNNIPWGEEAAFSVCKVTVQDFYQGLRDPINEI